MNRILIVIGVVFTLSMGCATSTEFTKVNPADISANGDAIAVINSNGFAVTFFFHLAQPWDEGSLKHVINKALVKQAKQLGGNKVELLYAGETPKDGLYALTGSVIGVSQAHASGVAIK